MTPEDLRTAVTAALSAGRLDLDLAGLLPAPEAGYLADLLPGGRLTLTRAGATPTGDGVTVVGTGDATPLLGTTVTVTLSVDPAAAGTPVRAVLDAAASAPWSFTANFPTLRRTFFDGQLVEDARLSVDSAAVAAAEAAEAGSGAATFTGTLVVGTRLALLDLLLPGAVHALTGDIRMISGLPGSQVRTSTVPDLVLYGPTGGRVDLGLFAVENLRYEIFGQPRFDYYRRDLRVLAYLRVTGTIPVTVAGNRHDVLTYVDIAGDASRVRLLADLSALGTLRLDEVAALTGPGGLSTPVGPAIVSPVVPTELELVLTPGGTALVESVRVLLQTQEEWDVVPGLPLTLQAVDVTFAILRPLSSTRQVSGSVRGLLAIGEYGTLDLSVDFASRTLQGALREGDPPLHVREVYEHFTGSPAGHLPDVTVDAFSFSLTLPQQDQPVAYGGRVDLGDVWRISDELVLQQVSFLLAHQDGATTFTARAVFDAGWATVDLDATYDAAPAQGWVFSGRTGSGMRIPFGALVDNLAQRYAGLALPAPLADLTVHDLGAQFTTGTRALYLTAGVSLPVDGAELDLTVTVDTARRLFTGELTVTVNGTALIFDVRFADDPAAQRFVAALRHDGAAPVPTVHQIVATLSPSAAAYVPDGITVDVRDVLFVVDRTGPTTVYALAADLAATVDLARLPLVGERLAGGGARVGVDPLRLRVLSATLPATEVAAVNALLPAGLAALPDGDLTAGFSADAVLRLGDLTQALSLPAPDPAVAQPPPAPVPGQPPATDDNVVWYKVQRSFGPVTLDRIGVAYRRPPGRDAHLAFLLDASLRVAGLTLTLDGLAVTVSLAEPAAVPGFALRGLGLSYSAGQVEITGAFLAGTIEYEGRQLPAYSGRAVLRTSQFALGAIGSYAQLPQGPSMFVYAFLDYPLGGPPIFQVEGLAAGFGYNRRLVAPPVADIATFPLIAEAAGDRAAPVELADELRALRDYLPPSVGDFFLAVGVRFSSFRMIDSVVLLSVGFGHRFEVTVLGLSTMVLPSPDAATAGVPPLAQVQLALRATLVPDDGYLAVQAQLTQNSWLLARECRLTGGFAFQTWFGREHTGDFVLSAGGYHPRFVRPAHYPQVPRLGFTWRVSEQLTLKGGGYFALTPSTLMAGAAFTATWLDGPASAWFTSSMDFLIGWKPYHYEADVQVAIGVAYTFRFFGTHTIRASVSAQVSLWGPAFNAYATVRVGPYSFALSHGNDPRTAPKPVSWAVFRESFLPGADTVVGVVLQAGAVGTGPATGTRPPAGHLGTVDPLALVLRTDAAIPSRQGWSGPADAGRALDTTGARTAFGVAPVGRRSSEPVASAHRIEIRRADGSRAEGYFRFEPVTKNLPAAMWGDRLQPRPGDAPLVENLLTGYVIRVLPPQEPAVDAALARATLQAGAALHVQHDAWRWTPRRQFTPSGDDPAVRRQLIEATITAPETVQARNALAGALFPDDDPVDVDTFDVRDLLAVPLVEAAS